MTKCALVTGAAGGIGSAVAGALSPDHALVLVDLDAGALEELRRSLGPNPVLCLVADVTDEAAAADCVAQAVRAHGRLDALVNVVGGGRSGIKLPDVTRQDWDRVLTLSLTSTFLLCRAALPHLERVGGSIVNLSSVAGIRGMHESPAYCAAKGAVIGLTKALALDHGPAGVRVNCVAPGAVETPMLRKHRTQEQIAALGAGSLTGRVARPQEIASVVRWLLGDGASYVMGQTIEVDGGLPTLA